MGFFGSLFGWDQSMGALNAVLASHFIEKAPNVARQKIAREVFNIVTSVRRGQPLERILSELSNESRVVQMNFIALACDNLGIDPPVRNNVWTRVKNPYQLNSQVDTNHLSAAVDVLFKQDGVKVVWPGNEAKIDFQKMYSNGAVS